MEAVTQVKIIAEKDMNTVFKSQRTAPGTFGPVISTISFPVPEKAPLKGILKVKRAVG